MTYTALATLKTLGDGLDRIHRTGIIEGENKIHHKAKMNATNI